MTEEEMMQEIETLRAANESLQTANDDLTAERDSLAEENNTLRESVKAVEDEARKTKQLNYTLARQLDAKPKATFEESLLNLVKRG